MNFPSEAPEGKPPRVPRVPCPFLPCPTTFHGPLLTSSNFLALYWSAPLRKLSRMMSHRTVPWGRTGRASPELPEPWAGRPWDRQTLHSRQKQGFLGHSPPTPASRACRG